MEVVQEKELCKRRSCATQESSKGCNKTDATRQTGKLTNE
jgi:hypothetical protein